MSLLNAMVALLRYRLAVWLLGHYRPTDVQYLHYSLQARRFGAVLDAFHKGRP